MKASLSVWTRNWTRRGQQEYTGGSTFAATTYARLFARLAGAPALPYISRAAGVAQHAGCLAAHAGKALEIIDCWDGEADY